MRGGGETYVILLVGDGRLMRSLCMGDGTHVILLCVGWETYEILLVGDGRLMRSLCIGDGRHVILLWGG